MQQDCVKTTNHSDSKLHCEVHPENELQILHFGEKSQRKSRMLCVQCIMESCNKKENLDQFVYLNNFLVDPKNTIFKIHNIDKDQNQGNVSKVLDELDKLVSSFEETIRNQVLKIKENIQQMRIQIQQQGEYISNELKLNDVVKQIQLLKQLDSCQGTSELADLENQLNFISENLNKSYLNSKNKSDNNQCTTAKKILDNLFVIKNEIDSTQKKFIDNLTTIDMIEGVEEIKDFPQIHKLISEGKTIEYQLLYSSIRDGLNGQVYQTKCNLQQNLLTIMTSKNGNKFGGYSPCQLNYNSSNSHIQDPSMKSFIFQYNKKEIYRLKNKEHAVSGYQSHGPTFGNWDIHVNINFDNGHSHALGTTYDISGYNIVDKTNHIFGATTPQLQECKVYKVIFK